jgi:hypothetical protein
MPPTKKATMPSKKKVVPWIKSEAKQALRQDIIDGIVTDQQKAREVYQMRPAYQDYVYDNFQANLRALRLNIKLNIQRALEDSADLYHDLELHPRSRLTNRGVPFWDTSKAKKLLSRDIKNGLHLRLAPSELWITNPEYLKYPLTTFRNHIYQKVRTDKDRAYWMAKKNLKKT